MKKVFFHFFIFLIITSIGECKVFNINVLSKQALVINADNGHVLYEKNADIIGYPASITKIAVALYIIDKKNHLLDRSYIASKEALKYVTTKEKQSGGYTCPSYWLETGSKLFGIIRGEALPIESLLYALLLVSGNDAANVLAEACSKDVSAFMDELNRYLKDLGCKNTNFCNPHGLHHPNHVTTPNDMAIITRKALTFPLFRKIVSTVSYIFPKTNKQKEKEILQYNGLLREGKYYYPYAIGVKTGVHSHAKYTLVAAAEHNGRSLIAVLLGAKERQDRYIDAKNLFDLAFLEKKQKRMVFHSSQIFTKNLQEATKPLRGCLEEDLTYEYYASEEPKMKAYLQWDMLSFPITKGDKIGEVRIKDEYNEILKIMPIIAKEDVSLKWFYWVKHKINNFIKR